MAKSEALSTSTVRDGPLQKSATEERFTRMAETLDAAGLGPADYLYLPLKWRLQIRISISFRLGGPCAD